MFLLRQVPLNPLPWLVRWERRVDMKGFTYDPAWMSAKRESQRFIEHKPWEKYDLMREYRRTGSEALKEEIYKDVYLQQQDINKAKDEERKVLVAQAKAKARVRRKKRAPVAGAVFVSEDT